jgi:hypothetical protein
MNSQRHFVCMALAAAMVLCFLPQTAFGYIGPGAGLSAIGALLAVIVGVVVAILGFVWYPLRRILRKRRSAAADEAGTDA